MDLKLIKSKDLKELKDEIKNMRTENAEFQDEWLNTEDAATFLKIHKRTLKRYRDLGKIPYSGNGRVIRFKKSDLISFLKQTYIPTEISNKK